MWRYLKKLFLNPVLIVEAFNEEPLMPTFGKGHAPAKHLYQGKVSLKELLSAEDIEFLIEYDDVPPQWSANRELQGTNTERFMSGLAIQDWDVADFLEVVAEKAKEKWGGPDEAFMTWLDVVNVVKVAGFGFAVRKHPLGFVVFFAPFKNIGQLPGDR